MARCVVQTSDPVGVYSLMYEPCGLGDEDVAVGERGVAVGAAERRGWVVHARPRGPDLAARSTPLGLMTRMRQLSESATVTLPFFKQVGVVRLVEVSGRRTGLRRVAVAPQELPARVRDLDDGLVLLLVGDDGRAVVDEEGVVGEVEAARTRRWRHGRRVRVGPDDRAGVVEHQQAVVAPVRDRAASRRSTGSPHRVPPPRRTSALGSSICTVVGRRRPALAADQPRRVADGGDGGVGDRCDELAGHQGLGPTRGRRRRWLPRPPCPSSPPAT